MSRRSSSTGKRQGGIESGFTRRRKALLFVTSLALLAPIPAAAQNGGLRGKVVDDSGRPIEGVEILLEFTGGVRREMRFESDEKGTFVRMGIRLGDYRLTLQKEGYESLVEDIKIPAGPPTRIGERVLRRDAAVSKPESAGSDAEPQVLATEALALVESGDYRSAVEAFEVFIAQNPDSSEAHYNLGITWRRLEDEARALEYFQNAVGLEPAYYEAYVAIGDVHGKGGRWTEAVSALEHAVRLRPESPGALFSYAGAAMNLGELAKAREGFEKLIVLDPAHANAHYQLGMISVNQNELDSAIAHLKKYLELEPDGPLAAPAKQMVEALGKQ